MVTSMQSTFRFGTVGSPLSTPPNKPGGTVGGIRRLAELGLDALELAWVRSVRISPAACEAIRAEGAQHGVALSVHAPYFINLNADSAEWPKSRKRIMDAAQFGNLAGATDIVIHPGSYFGNPPGEVLPTAVSRLKDCIAELRSEGNPATLRPETMGKPALMGSLDDVLHMAQEVDGVLPCLDFAHLHARTGDGTANSYDEWMKILEQIGIALGTPFLQKLHIHLSGIEYGPRGERKHLTFKEADLKYRQLLKALVDSHCSGRIMCESPILEEDAILLRNTWKKILAEAG
jgi:deoxyribonuclease-4